MILVFEDKKVREKFERRLKEACVYHRIESEIFGEDVSSEDYMVRRIIGSSIPFYKEIFRKNVAQKALSNEVLILDSDPCIPESVNKCPVIYITDRTRGNDEEFGQLPVKYAGNVESTMEEAKRMLGYWLDKYGNGRREQDFYHDLLDAAMELVPKKLRLIACERLHGNYAAGVTVDFCDRNFTAIINCINEVKAAGYRVFVDDKVGGYFNVEDYYYTILEAGDMESFLEVANTLKDKNDDLIKNKTTLMKAVDDRTERWILEIYENIYLDHIKDNVGYVKIPEGYFQIYYENVSYDLRLEKLGVEVHKDDVVFLKKVIDYLQEDLMNLDGEVCIRMYFYGGEILDELYDQSLKCTI